MNKSLRIYARKELKESLNRCTSAQQTLFKRMYAHGNLNASIEDVIDNMEAEKLDRAMTQVQNTLNK